MQVSLRREELAQEVPRSGWYCPAPDPHQVHISTHSGTVAPCSRAPSAPALEQTGPQELTRPQHASSLHDRPKLLPLHSSLKTPLERRGQGSTDSGSWSSLLSTSAEGFTGWTHEECTPCSCSPVDASPRSQDGKWYWVARLKFNLESGGVCMGQGQAGLERKRWGPSWDSGLYIQFSS